MLWFENNLITNYGGNSDFTTDLHRWPQIKHRLFKLRITNYGGGYSGFTTDFHRWPQIKHRLSKLRITGVTKTG